MSRRPTFRRRLAPIAGLVAAVGLFAAVPTLAHPQSAQASVSAGDVVFQQNSDGNSNIVLLDTGDSTETALTSGNGDQQPDVSLDGSKVAYVWTPETGGNGIAVVNTDGTGQTNLTSPTEGTPFTDTYPRWSPTGTQIAFTRHVDSGGTNSQDIMAMNGDGSDVRDLTPDTAANYDLNYPTWSPDGSRIAYTEQLPSDSYYNAVVVMNADGTNPHVIYTDESSCTDTGIDWSSNGSRIYDFRQCGAYGHIEYLTSSDSFGSGDDATLNDLVDGLGDSNGQIRLSGDGSAAYYDNYSKLYSADTTSGDATLVANDTETAGDIDPTPVDADGATQGYAVLGDSYSSGEGVPAGGFISPTNTDGCDRSTLAYAKDLNSFPDGLSMTGFVACSGATSPDVITGMDGESSQLGAITSGDKYVILTVGGDDVDFADFAYACTVTSCASDTTAYSDIETAIADDLPSDLANLFSYIASDVSAGTRVLVLGYPNILPATDAGYPNTCAGDMTTGSQDAAKAVESDLNSAIATAVSTYGAPFEFIDPNAAGSAFAGHTLCSTDGYFNDVSIPTKYSFHPNAAGQAAYATVVAQYLLNHP